MRAMQLLNMALAVLFLSACEIENSLELENPYQTARIVLVLEQRGISYRLAQDGVIHYHYELEDEVEAARQQAYRLRASTSAVIARTAQAKLIVEQFENAGINFDTKQLEHFMLITWDYPRLGETQIPADRQ